MLYLLSQPVIDIHILTSRYMEITQNSIHTQTTNTPETDCVPTTALNHKQINNNNNIKQTTTTTNIGRIVE